MSTPIMGLYDEPFWNALQQERRFKLQSCSKCQKFRYPPGPACPNCGSAEHSWVELSGRGTILSWVVYHKQYLPLYPAPYNVIAVRLAEGPIIISNLVGPKPEESWVGHNVSAVLEENVEGMVLPRFELAQG